MEERFIVQTSTPERKFIKVYLDFLNAGLLSGKEQIIFIHLKQYINFANDNGTIRGEVYPTLATLAKNVKMTEKTVRTVLQGLQKKGILEIRQQGMNKPNIYKINDSADMWKAESMEELKAAVDEIEEKRMIEALTAKGYYISKEKGLVSDSSQTADTSTNENYAIYKEQNTTDQPKSQAERYTMQDIKALYEYDSLIIQYPAKQTDIDIVFEILYETLNSTKKTIRIGGEDKPPMVVIGKLMKLQPDDLIYSIDKYHEQDQRIKNVKAYLLTVLYNSREQSYLDLMNEGHYNHDF
ncbi:MAG: helix-turn-helix domain-containing protein [Clostridium sp.]|nr:helix-turn-helix domain-containing protein [Clostridium sp.]